MSKIEAGTVVKFVGFTGNPDETPDNGELLKVGETYEVEGLVEVGDGEDQSYNIKIPNPEYDSSKRRSKSNREFILVDVFEDEVEVVAQEEEPVDQEPVDQEQEAPAEEPTAKTGKTKTKVTVKSKGRAKVKAEPEAEQEAEPKTAAKSKSRPTIKAKPKSKVTDNKLPARSAAQLDEAALREELGKDVIVLATSEEDEDILSLCAEAEDLCALAREQRDESVHVEYTLGGILYHVCGTGAYKSLSPEYAEKEGFAKYCENELGLRYRKARYLIGIYAKVNRFGIPKEWVQRVGWTKASIAVQAMNEDNAESLVELAESSTVTELKESIKESESTVGPVEKVKKVKFTFSLTEELGAAVAEYFEQAREALGVESDSEVFEHIVTEWASEHLNVKPTRGHKHAA